MSKKLTWFRLDCQFFLDDKIIDLCESYSEGHAFRYVSLIGIAISEYSGRIDLGNATTARKIARLLNVSQEELFSTINACVECGLFDAERWQENLVTSHRLADEAEELTKSVNRYVKAGQASAAARKKKEQR